MPFAGFEHIKHPQPADRNAYKNYTCGHCGNKVTGFIVANYDYGSTVDWLICPSCGDGSVYSSSHQIYPGSLFGPELQGLPVVVREAYTEMRNCMSVNAFTASELLCRKILMHISVEKGAKEGGSFESYIDFLEKNGYITPPMKMWVDLIREHGNEATHLLEAPDSTRAQSTALFTVQLLRLVYEMKHIADNFPPKRK